MSRYTPTPADQSLVRELAAIGASQEDIAAKISIPVPKLQKLFKRELQQGAAEGKLQALRKLHDIALAGENVTALSFYVKARCGWRDTGTPSGNAGTVVRLLRIGNFPKPPCAPSTSI